MSPSTEKARKGRKDMADRCLAVAFICLPEGWTFEYRRHLTGRCFYFRRHIAAPRPVTRRALQVWLHECGHAVLHGPDKPRKPRHVEEFEAEKYSFDMMRKYGIAVPRKSVENAKAYVRYKIEQAVRRGVKEIDPKARSFAKR